MIHKLKRLSRSTSSDSMIESINIVEESINFWQLKYIDE